LVSITDPWLDVWVEEPTDNARLSQAVEAADLRVLLMALFHRTGDHKWLRSPYLPQRDVRLVAEFDAGLPPDIQHEIRTAAVAAFADHSEPAISDPGDALMLTMMQVCLGEKVGAEYAPLMREDLRFVSKDVGLEISAETREAPGVIPDVLIVGAGVSGIAIAAQLGRLGIPYQIVEKSSEVGGTWWDNRYPGCGVDTPNHAYSYSLGTRPKWTRYFSLRDEIEAYVIQSAVEFGVREKVEFATTVVEATWDEKRSGWVVTTEKAGEGRVTRFVRVLISAVGVLNIPKFPPGLDVSAFSGEVFHSARWPDHATPEFLSGKRVAVIGTGATAMQLVPSIADSVRELTVYQRSPQWSRAIDGYRSEIDAESQWLFEHVPYYLEWFRFTMWWRYGDGLLRHLRRDPEWPHPERSMNRVNDRHRQEMTDFIASELDGRPDLLAKCLPTYPPYGKRILIDNGWFRTLTKDNVTLVTEAVDEVTGDGVRIGGVERQHDVLIFATGFETSQLTARLNVTGRNGRRLELEWAGDNPSAHLGISVPGFPNLFMMLGPNTGLGHGGSTIFMSECQARYISSCLVHMAEQGLASVEVDQVVHDEYVASVNAEHAELIWTHPGMTNWYRNKAGRITALLPWRLVDYWSMTHDPNWPDFRVTKLVGDPEVV
jgi:4-hydroxyacetophenone monooxygenase